MQLTIPDQRARSWSSALVKALVQIVAQRNLEKDEEQFTQTIMIQKTGTSSTVSPDAKPTPKSNAWLLRKRAARDKLGNILRSKKHDRQLKVIAQAITNSYPTQANLPIW